MWAVAARPLFELRQMSTPDLLKKASDGALVKPEARNGGKRRGQRGVWMGGMRRPTCYSKHVKPKLHES